MPEALKNTPRPKALGWPPIRRPLRLYHYRMAWTMGNQAHILWDLPANSTIPFGEGTQATVHSSEGVVSQTSLPRKKLRKQPSIGNISEERLREHLTACCGARYFWALVPAAFSCHVSFGNMISRLMRCENCWIRIRISRINTSESACGCKPRSSNFVCAGL